MAELVVERLEPERAKAADEAGRFQESHFFDYRSVVSCPDAAEPAAFDAARAPGARLFTRRDRVSYRLFRDPATERTCAFDVRWLGGKRAAWAPGTNDWSDKSVAPAARGALRTAVERLHASGRLATRGALRVELRARPKPDDLGRVPADARFRVDAVLSASGEVLGSGHGRSRRAAKEAAAAAALATGLEPIVATDAISESMYVASASFSCSSDEFSARVDAILALISSRARCSPCTSSTSARRRCASASPRAMSSSSVSQEEESGMLISRRLARHSRP